MHVWLYGRRISVQLQVRNKLEQSSVLEDHRELITWRDTFDQLGEGLGLEPPEPPLVPVPADTVLK